MLAASPELSLRISDAAWSEARHELSKRLDKVVGQGRMERGQADDLLREAIELAEARVVPVPREVYEAHEQEAEYRVPRDPDDIPTVALALALGARDGWCAIWTGDHDFFGCGLPVWVTDTLVAHLEHHRSRQ